jgi:2-isopropylmalate synthase
LPRRLQVEFSAVVQKHTDSLGKEIGASDLWQLFSKTYLDTASPLRYLEHHLCKHDKGQGIRLSLAQNGVPQELTGQGNGPIDAAVQALQSIGLAMQVRSYEERSMGSGVSGADAQACAFIELAVADGHAQTYGVGIDSNIVTASLKALLSGVNRLASRRE